MNFTENFKVQMNYIRADYSVYLSKKGDANFMQTLLYMMTCHGWHIMFFFRVGKIIYSIKIPIFSQILKIVFQLIWFLLTTFYGIWIDLSSNIGPGFYIGHYGSIIVRGNIGANCAIGQAVTIGSKGAGKSNGWPQIGDNVFISAGAKIIGKIKVGDNVTIGANCVVIKNVPDNTLAVGVPATIKPLSD